MSESVVNEWSASCVVCHAQTLLFFWLGCWLSIGETTTPPSTDCRVNVFRHVASAVACRIAPNTRNEPTPT